MTSTILYQAMDSTGFVLAEHQNRAKTIAAARRVAAIYIKHGVIPAQPALKIERVLTRREPAGWVLE